MNYTFRSTVFRYRYAFNGLDLFQTFFRSRVPEVCLGASQASAMEISCENSCISCVCKKDKPSMFQRILNMPWYTYTLQNKYLFTQP